MFDFNGIKVVSFFPGRVRLRIEKLETDSGFADKIKSGLSDIPGIKKLEVKESNNSILVVYDKKKLKQPDASKRLIEELSTLFPDADIDKVKGLLGI
ncbi:MAG: hypothetical protein PVG75_12705 [Thioalkalispiraceae bacterium]